MTRPPFEFCITVFSNFNPALCVSFIYLNILKHFHTRTLIIITMAEKKRTHISFMAESLAMALTSMICCLLALVAMVSCQTSDDSADNMSPQVAQFVARYFPGYAVEQCTVNAGVTHVKLKNGPGIVFDASDNLESVNGYGMPLPQVLLFDTLPPSLFDYLQSGENLDNVFSVKFTPRQVTVELLETTVVYDIASGRIRDIDTPPVP